MSDRLRLWTADDIYDPDVENIELIHGKPVGGKLVRRRMGEFRRFVVEAALLWHLGRFVVPRRLGLVLPGAGFVAPNGRALLPPDVAFYRDERLPPTRVWDGLSPIAPELVAEVPSINDEWEWFGERNHDLVSSYLEAGVKLAWVCEPRQRTVQVRRPNGATTTLTADDWLDGEEILPGFRLPVAALFRPPTPDE
jgi:Uma2 family endonuclease